MHGTSLSENNTLTSTDNKGIAALRYERMVEPDSLPGHNSFLAGFIQASVGDTTPNTLGAKCPDGSDCDYETSTCLDPATGKNTTVTCLGRGPAFGDEAARAVSPTGGYDFRSNEIIAQLQVDAAKDVMDRSDLLAVSGPVRSVKMNVDMGHYQFKLENGTEVTTCPAALGFGFAGGTTDGPGPKGFNQGANKTDPANPLFNLVSHLIRPPSAKQTECHAPKRILFSTGQLDLPYQWSPHIVETQILSVGDFFILVIPGEMTTMAGRRLKGAVRQALISNGVSSKPVVVIAGPANTYAHYVSTREEYIPQRYEGASTLFGQYTLEAYIDIYSKTLVPALKEGAADPPAGQLAPINIKRAYKLQTPVVYDNPVLLKSFGDVLEQPLAAYTINSNLKALNNVTASFVAANPRNDLRLDGTYFEVQRQAIDGTWQVVRTDGHETTTMRWTRISEATGSSRVDIAWAIEPETPPGKYRIVYYGDSKTPVTGKIHGESIPREESFGALLTFPLHTGFTGTTEEFDLQ